jgi:hypothetical protein
MLGQVRTGNPNVARLGQVRPGYVRLGRVQPM